MIKVNVEIADTPASLAHGLMHRQELEENNGMLFKFPFQREASFWGKNTYIPLDIAFIDSNGIITDIKQITPLSTKQVWSSGLCSMALETNAGFFFYFDIKVGYKVELVSNEDKQELIIKQC